MTEKDMRLTVGKLKQMLKGVPDNAIVCCQSDEEGNRTMVCCDCYKETVGKKVVYNDLHNFSYIEGEDVIGLDLKKDKGAPYVVIRPLY